MVICILFFSISKTKISENSKRLERYPVFHFLNRKESNKNQTCSRKHQQNS